MKAYLDASVVLRRVLEQPDSLCEWDEVRTGVSSALLPIECFRTLDQARLRSRADSETIARRHAHTVAALAPFHLVAIDDAVLLRASQPMPTALGTLDAIHLVTALLWQELNGESLVMATHDLALATAARAYGMRVIGV